MPTESKRKRNRHRAAERTQQAISNEIESIMSDQELKESMESTFKDIENAIHPERLAVFAGNRSELDLKLGQVSDGVPIKEEDNDTDFTKIVLETISPSFGDEQKQMIQSFQPVSLRLPYARSFSTPETSCSGDRNDAAFSSQESVRGLVKQERGGEQKDICCNHESLTTITYAISPIKQESVQQSSDHNSCMCHRSERAYAIGNTGLIFYWHMFCSK